MSQHVNRNQVGLYVFILTAGALGLAGAGYLLGLDTPSWLTIFATTGLGSLATAWRPGSGNGEPATPTPVKPQAAKVEPQPQPFVYPDPASNPYLPDTPPLPVSNIPPMTGPTGPEHGIR